MSKTQELIGAVVQAHDVLTTESDLSPRNPKVNEALTRLVTAVICEYSPAEEKAVLSDPQVMACRRALLGGLAKAEGEMEKYWAEEFCLRRELTTDDFKDFIYWACYDRLVGGEVRQLPKGKNFAADDTIAFIGAGPLPLTAFILHLQTGKKVTCVDIDPEACRLAQALCEKAGLDGIDVVCSDGATYDYDRHPVVFVASLVPNKDDVIAKIKEAGRDTFIGLRSAERLHTLLYDPVDEASLRAAGCSYASQTGHDPKTINTTVFYNAPPVLDRLRSPVAATRHPDQRPS